LLLERANAEYAYITDANQTGLDGVAKLTLQGWAYLTTAVSSSDQRIAFIGKYLASTPNITNRSYFITLFYNAGQPVMQSTVSGNASSASYQTNRWYWDTPLNVWFHWAIVFDTTQAVNADQIKWYLNGVDQGSPDTEPNSNNLSTIENSARNFSVGYWDIDANAWDGRMADVRAYTGVARTPAQVQADYQQTIAPDANTSVWLFDETLTDEGSRDNDLVASGAISYVEDYPY
jgi:hypothetical protein